MQRRDWPLGGATSLALTLSVLTLVFAGGCAGTSARREPSSKVNAAAMQVELAQGYLQKNDLGAARDKLKRALELDPDSAPAHTLTAILNERIARPEVAELHYRRALELKPDVGDWHNNFGVFLCGQGRLDEARAEFEKALMDPFYKTPALAYANAAVCAEKGGDAEASEKFFRKALEIDRNNLDALSGMARLSLLRDERLRARAFIERYDAVRPLEPGLLELAAQIEESLGDSAAASIYRDRLRKSMPDYVAPEANGTVPDE